MSEKRIKRMEMRHTAGFEAQIKAGIADAMKSQNGRAMLWEFLSLTGMFRNPHTSNALNTAFNAGRQSAGQDIIGMIEEVNPHGYVIMVQESVDRDLALAAKIKEELTDDTD